MAEAAPEPEGGERAAEARRSGTAGEGGGHVNQRTDWVGILCCRGHIFYIAIGVSPGAV